MQITGGKVTFSRSVQPAQYESKKAEVEISFVLGEGEELGASLDVAAGYAQSKALEMVGLAKPATPVAYLTGAKEPAAGTPIKEAAAAALNAKDKTPTAAVVTPKRPPGRPPKPAAEPAKDPASIEDDAGHASKIEEHKVVNGAPRAISETPEDRKDPADIEDEFAVEAAEITDATVSHEVQVHNAKIKNPTAIKQLIQKFVGKTPCTLRDIPQAVRSQFLSELAKL